MPMSNETGHPTPEQMEVLKAYGLNPIEGAEDAMMFLVALERHGLAWHMDDDPADCLGLDLMDPPREILAQGLRDRVRELDHWLTRTHTDKHGLALHLQYLSARDRGEATGLEDHRLPDGWTFPPPEPPVPGTFRTPELEAAYFSAYPAKAEEFGGMRLGAASDELPVHGPAHAVGEAEPSDPPGPGAHRMGVWLLVVLNRELFVSRDEVYQGCSAYASLDSVDRVLAADFERELAEFLADETDGELRVGAERDLVERTADMRSWLDRVRREGDEADSWHDRWGDSEYLLQFVPVY